MQSKSLKPFLYLFLVIALITNSSICYGQASSEAQAGPSPLDIKNVFGLGMGYGGGLGGPGIGYNLLPGYSGSISPGIMLTYEHTFTKRFGIGASFSFSAASSSVTNVPYTIDTTMHYTSGTFNNSITGTYMSFAARGLYHFKGTKKFDPYCGFVGGVTLTKLNSTVTTIDGTYTSHFFFPGILTGVIVGAKYFFNDTIGAWAEAGYSGAPDYLLNIGVAYKLKKAW